MGDDDVESRGLSLCRRCAVQLVGGAVNNGPLDRRHPYASAQTATDRLTWLPGALLITAGALIALAVVV